MALAFKKPNWGLNSKSELLEMRTQTAIAELIHKELQYFLSFSLLLLMIVSTILNCWNLQTSETKNARNPFEILMSVPRNLAPKDTVRRPHLINFFNVYSHFHFVNRTYSHCSSNCWRKCYAGISWKSVIYIFCQLHHLQLHPMSRPLVTGEPSSSIDKIRQILTGELPVKFNMEFLSRNNKADLLIQENAKNSLDSCNSAHHSALALANAFMNAGT